MADITFDPKTLKVIEDIINASVLTVSEHMNKLVDQQSTQTKVTERQLEISQEQLKLVGHNTVMSKRLSKKMEDSDKFWMRQRKNESRTVTESQGIKTFDYILDELKTQGAQRQNDNNEVKTTLRDKVTELIENNKEGIANTLSKYDTVEDRREAASKILSSAVESLGVDEDKRTMFLDNMGDDIINSMVKGQSNLEKIFGSFGTSIQKSFGGIKKSISSFYETKIGGFLKKGFDEVKNVFTSDIEEILGPELIAIKNAMGNVFSHMFDWLSDDTDEDKTHSLLDASNEKLFDISQSVRGLLGVSEDQLALDKEKWLAEQRAIKDEKPGGLAKILIGVGAILGAIVGVVINQFKLLIGGIEMILKPVKFIGNTFEKIASVFKPLTSRLAKIGKLFTSVEDIGKMFDKAIDSLRFLEKIPKFGKMMFKGMELVMKNVSWIFKGFAFGVKTLAIPLQIILSAIDFIKGFIGTEGTFMDKLKGGLWGVVEGLVELPVKAVGWVIDKVLGMVGIEGAESANKIMDAIKLVFNGIMEAVMLPHNLMMSMIDIAKPLIDTVITHFKNMFMIMFESFAALWNLVEGIMTGDFTAFTENLNNIKGLFTESIQNITDGFTKFFENIASIPDKIWGYLKDKFSNVPLIGKFFGGGEKEEKVEPKVIRQTTYSINGVLVDEDTWNRHQKQSKEGDIKWIEDEIKTFGESPERLKRLEKAKAERDEYDKKITAADTERKIPAKTPEQPTTLEQAKQPTTLEQVAPPKQRVVQKDRVVENTTETKRESFFKFTPSIADWIRGKDDEETVKSPQPMMSEDINNVNIAEASAQRRVQTNLASVVARQGRDMQGNQKELVESMGKTITENNINTNVQQRINPNAQTEIPTDIEALGILFFNKTWGVA